MKVPGLDESASCWAVSISCKSGFIRWTKRTCRQCPTTSDRGPVREHAVMTWNWLPFTQRVLVHKKTTTLSQ